MMSFIKKKFEPISVNFVQRRFRLAFFFVERHAFLVTDRFLRDKFPYAPSSLFHIWTSMPMTYYPLENGFSQS